ncbi:hypothetical protein OH492_16850 [Vibrio chagasii]|nr:hypothetical protein [Vibrio chagasii]
MAIAKLSDNIISASIQTNMKLLPSVRNRALLTTVFNLRPTSTVQDSRDDLALFNEEAYYQENGVKYLINAKVTRARYRKTKQ